MTFTPERHFFARIRPVHPTGAEKHFPDHEESRAGFFSGNRVKKWNRWQYLCVARPVAPSPATLLCPCHAL
ncbi:MAG: hypothetical protein ABF535_09010 [Acetobacter sp.]